MTTDASQDVVFHNAHYRTLALHHDEVVKPQLRHASDAILFAAPSATQSQTAGRARQRGDCHPNAARPGSALSFGGWNGPA